MKTTFISFLFFCFSFLLQGQNNSVSQIIEDNFSKIEIPVLSQSQMLADFDTLAYLLKNVYPYYNIKAQLYATDYDKELAKLQSQISTIHKTNDFIWILYKAVNMFGDKHLEIPHPQALNYYQRNTDRFTVQLTPENIVCTDKCYLLTHDSLQVKVKLGLRFKYLDGKYYSLRAFKYKNQIYPEGILLTSIDGMSVDDFVNRYYTSMAGISYDVQHKKYFSEFFFLSPEFANQKTHQLAFENAEKKIFKDIFYTNTTVENLSKKQEQQDNPAVFTIQDSILYIRLPIMNDETFYIQEIQKQFDPVQTKKIVLDIRGNRGGMDKVWSEILSSIITDTIKQDITFYANNSREIKEHLFKNGFDSIKTEYVPLLKSEKLIVNQGKDIFAPKENSIRFNGKIIILQDENTFSAAGSLLTIAKQQDHIISIGYNMNDLGGRGLSPFLCQLPYTKILIRMPFVIDYSGVNQWSDFLRNIPEVKCEESVSVFLQNYYSTNPYQLEALLKDKCFLEAISL